MRTKVGFIIASLFICITAYAWPSPFGGGGGSTAGGSATVVGGVTTNDGGVSGNLAIYNGPAVIGPAGNAKVVGSMTIQNSTATDDKIVLSVTTGGAGSFTGTISPADLTANRAFTLPNWPGTVYIPTTVGTLTTVAHGDPSGQPVFGPVTLSDLNFTPLTTTSDMWCAQIFLGATGGGIKAANTVLAQWKTGSTSTVTDVLFATNVVGTAGTGTATLDLTDTSGVVKCTINFDCTTADQIGNGSCSSTALSANTIYQARAKAQCAGTGSIMYPYTCWKNTTP